MLEGREIPGACSCRYGNILAAIALSMLGVSFLLQTHCIASPESMDSADALLEKARILIEEAPTKATGIAAAPLYNEPLKLLDEITSKYHDDTEANLQAEKMKAICYDHQAKYAEKHQALKRYADLLAYGNAEASASWIAAEASEYLEMGEEGEAIQLYRLIVTAYPTAKNTPDVLHKIAETNSQGCTRYGSFAPQIHDYKQLTERYPQSGASARAELKLAELYWAIGDRQDAVNYLTAFITRYPSSSARDREEALWKLAQWYSRMRDSQNARLALEEYVADYPRGRYLTIARSLLQGFSYNQASDR